ncbi:MAG TPA: DUF6350 family protein [Pseudolysinimonas sp.]|jgi:hypothetical protein|nr:DUF6350 family protein [Pseudolysinimonas sp.]
MTRRLTVLLAALEAALSLAIGVAIPLVPLTIIWAAQFGFGPDWLIFWRGAVDVWLLGHGVDVTFTLPAQQAAALGVSGAGAPVVVTLALLGFALLTVLLGVRAGGRIADSGHGRLGVLSAAAAFALLSLGITLTALHPMARPSIWQGTLLPALVFAVGLGLGMLRAAGRRETSARGRLARRWAAVPIDTRAIAEAGLRAGTAAASVVLLISAVALGLRLIVGYAEIIRLYEALHTEVVGGIAVTALQLALLPDLVIWAAAWFTGPGFALGTGSHVSPLGTAVGPVPALPVLGAVPTADFPLAFAGLLVPVVAGFVAGVAVRPALARALDGIRPPAVLLTGVLGGAVGAVLLALLAWAASGSAGPGRLSDVGPSPVAVGFAALLELAPAIAVGLAVGRRR